MVPSNVATATELSNGSCSQRRCAGFGVMTQTGPDQPQVVTLARAEHHAMFAEADGLASSGRRWSGAP